MSDIDIRRRHARPVAELRSALDELATALAGKFGMRCTWRGDDLEFARPGVDGRLSLAPGEIRLRARLGLMMRPLRAAIEREIERYLDRYLG